MDGRAEGVPLELELTRGRREADCRPLAGRAIYLWQNDAAGAYSLYDLPDENYLRGLQPADAQGRVRFTAIVPGCYGGRYPHCHFEVFESAEAALARRRGRCWSRSSPSPMPNAARSIAATRATARACAISSGSRCRATSCSATPARRDSSWRWPGIPRAAIAGRRRSRSAERREVGHGQPERCRAGRR